MPTGFWLLDFPFGISPSIPGIEAASVHSNNKPWRLPEAKSHRCVFLRLGNHVATFNTVSVLHSWVSVFVTHLRHRSHTMDCICIHWSAPRCWPRGNGVRRWRWRSSRPHRKWQGAPDYWCESSYMGPKGVLPQDRGHANYTSVERMDTHCPKSQVGTSMHSMLLMHSLSFHYSQC
jgi:hypothetical protein